MMFLGYSDETVGREKLKLDNSCLFSTAYDD